MSTSLPASMRAIVITRPGGPEVLEVRDMPVPAIGPDEVLVRVAAAGVNYPDLMQRAGRYDPPPGASPLPGLEISGIVVATGAGVTGKAAGDRVVALTNGGGYAEYAAVPAGQVLPLPAPLSLAQGAALPETFFTVEQTLVMRSGLAAGMTVLVHGAAGGIGGAAVQIATALGARAIAVVSGPEKAAYAESLGAIATIDHAHEDFVARTLELTGNKGADRIVALSGGDMLRRNCAAAARFGWIVQIATLGGDRGELPLGLLLGKALTLIGSTLRPRTSAEKAAIAMSLRERIWPHLESGRIAGPAIRPMAFSAATEAHRAQAARGHFGKLVLVTRFGESLD